jgi:hypothetical protein
MLTTDTVPGVAIRIRRHYEGPPGSANGGWAAGIAAGLLTDPDTPAGVPVEVTLRAPVPIDRALRGERTGERAFLMSDDGTVLVEAGRAATIAPPPPPVAVDVAERARASAVASPFPGCFGCGTERAGGLRTSVGPTGPGQPYATAWTPPAAAGDLPTRYLWAALDCPTGLVHLTDGGKALLGRLTVAVHRALAPGERHVLVAAPTGAERRKRFSTAALYTETGILVAHSDAIWITI